MFKTLLSPEARAALDFKRAEIRRLNSLANEALANELLSLAERALLHNPDILRLEGTYDASLISELIPEMCSRLGATITSKLPGNPARVRALSMRNLRRHVGSAVQHSARHRHGADWELLTSEPCNGNVVILAMDRLCPADVDDPEDVAARSIASIQRTRGETVTGMWSPEDPAIERPLDASTLAEDEAWEEAPRERA